ncbi:MAG: hypothetical protein KGQ57_08715 [Burkholderiales bacterium]|nr:hypothetical protein [Burkholderiales bacterium]
MFTIVSDAHEEAMLRDQREILHGHALVRAERLRIEAANILGRCGREELCPP